ncbi:MAG: protein kinase [Gammaproteobacteria bacterium]|nr:protein kinase [Gammaproteobacteria bacterium]
MEYFSTTDSFYEDCAKAVAYFEQHPEETKISRKKTYMLDGKEWSPPRSFLMMDHQLYELSGEGEIIGEGAFGRVKLLREINTEPPPITVGAFYAVKIETTNTPRQQQEYELSKKLEIALGEKLERVIHSDEAGDTKKYYTRMHYLGQSLSEFLEDPDVSDRERLSIAIQLCDAVDKLHRIHGYAHHDLKPENVLIDSQGVVHLIDFGYAMPLDAKQERITGSLLYQLGAEETAAFLEKQPESIASDQLRYLVDEVGEFSSTLTAEEKDNLALKRILCFPEKIRSVFCGGVDVQSVLTPSILRSLPPQLQSSIATETSKQCLDNKQVSLSMLSSQLKQYRDSLPEEKEREGESHFDTDSVPRSGGLSDESDLKDEDEGEGESDHERLHF